MPPLELEKQQELDTRPLSGCRGRGGGSAIPSFCPGKEGRGPEDPFRTLIHMFSLLPRLGLGTKEPEQESQRQQSTRWGTRVQKVDRHTTRSLAVPAPTPPRSARLARGAGLLTCEAGPSAGSASLRRRLQRRGPQALSTPMWHLFDPRQASDASPLAPLLDRLLACPARACTRS